MKRLLLSGALALFLVPFAHAQNDVVITGIIDAGLGGGLPKAVELYVLTDNTDLSEYALSVAFNGGGTGSIEQPLSGTANAGDFIYVTDDGNATNPGGTRFTEFFGFAADIVGNIPFNGDDAIELFYDDLGLFVTPTLVDVFGDVNVDGTGQPWEYTDGWVYRGSGTGPDATFVLGHWGYSGIDVLDGVADNASAPTPFPIGTYSRTGAQVADVAGWRLLGVPGSGQTVGDLADVNLVQGVTGEYPGADANLFLGYTGGGTGNYDAATASTENVPPGEGFMWYWFDADFGPFAGGTSESFELSTFALPLIGTEQTIDVTATLTQNTTDDYYMIANPFQEAFDVAGISVDNGTLSGSFLAYDPELGLGETGATSGGYIEATAGDLINVWQGVFAQVTGTTGDPTFTFAEASRNASANPAFYGRQDRPTTFALRLDGEVDVNGTLYPVVDAVTKVRFRAGATAGFDRFDLSELAPPNALSASLALVGERDGASHRLAVHSLPEKLSGSVTVPVAFTTSAAGTFTVTPELVSIPDGWTASLRDLETGAIVNLTGGETHTFSADGPTEWTTRFEMVVAASTVVDTEDAIAGFELGLVTPNPATASAALSLRVDAPQRVTVTVFDALGRAVQTAFADDVAPSADARIAIDTAVLAPGAYVVRVEGETFQQSRRLTVVR